MTPLAMLFMATALVSVSVLAGWCYYRVLFGRRRDSDGR